MTSLRDRPFIQGAARLMDLGGLLARRGERDHQAAMERAFQQAWGTVSQAMMQNMETVQRATATRVAHRAPHRATHVTSRDFWISHADGDDGVAPRVGHRGHGPMSLPEKISPQIRLSLAMSDLPSARRHYARYFQYIGHAPLEDREVLRQSLVVFAEWLHDAGASRDFLENPARFYARRGRLRPKRGRVAQKR